LYALKGYGLTLITEHGEERHDALLAAVCNGKTFGGGIKICPIAEVGDGQLEVMVVENPHGKMKIIKAFLTLMKGKAMEMPCLTHYSALGARFKTDEPVTVQLDGELYQDIEFDAKIGKGLSFFV
jgi:diacylglycerol kinase family enzyme